MRYLIIGLGIYGSNLARDLTEMGHEVIGVDIRKSNIDAIKDYISTVYLIDATDESALAILPLKNVDLVIVTIGENFGASIKVVAMLKKMKVKHIYARAIDSLHESILHGFGLDRIITPEQRAASDLTNEMAMGTHVQSLTVDANHYILKFEAPHQLVGYKYSDLDFGDHKLRLVAVSRLVEDTNILGISQSIHRDFDYSAPGATVQAGDTLICYGSQKAYANFEKQIKGL